MPSETAARRIVVGVDESDESVDALRWAVEDAKRDGALVDIVGVWDVEPVNVGIEQAVLTTPHGQPAERLARLDQVVEWIQPERDGVRYEVEVLSGDTGLALLDRAQGASLLVLGRPHRLGIPFGSHMVNHVLKHATCPVVLVPSRAQVIVESTH
jgi:nucleotide-binding universal stress UspA family protein